MKLGKKLALSLALTGAFALAACGPDAVDEGNNGNGNDAQEQQDQQLQGSVAIDGSSTVYPIMEAVAEEYQAEQQDVQVSVGVSGTGGGFKAFAAGETQISNASRPIKDEEKAALEEAGIEYTELELAYDGISIVVNKDNDWVDQLTVDELKKLWVEDGTTKKWSDIRPDWPEEEVKFYAPGNDSGTFDYFNEVVLEDEPVVEGVSQSEDDNVLVQGVTGDKNAIGFFGYSYYAENTDKLKVVPIVNPETGKAVEPSNETIEDGSYAPFSRPLFLYVDNEAVKEEHIYDFLKFTFENAGELATDVGYVSLPQEKYDEALSKIDELKQ